MSLRSPLMSGRSAILAESEVGCSSASDIDADDKIIRYPLPPDGIAPKERPQVGNFAGAWLTYSGLRHSRRVLLGADWRPHTLGSGSCCFRSCFCLPLLCGAMPVTSTPPQHVERPGIHPDASRPRTAQAAALTMVSVRAAGFLAVYRNERG
jgi:hypothetical protein